MKNVKKILALVIALVMCMAMGTVAFADAPESPATGTITITPPSNTNSDEQITYTIYKIFDASVNETTGAVTYKLMDGVTTTPEGFTANAAGYITDAPVSLTDTTTAFANYAAKQQVGTVTTTGTTAGVSEELEPGYYYITTTTGSSVIVRAGGNVEVEDKNELSTLVKSIGTEYSEDAKKAIAAVDSDVDFTVVVTKKHGATKLVVTDTLAGMTFNGDLTIEGATTSDYSVEGGEGDSEFTVTFNTNFVKNLADDTTLTLHYSGKVTSDALQTDPGSNTATLTTDNDHEVSDDVEVYNAKVTVLKTDGTNALPGAGFTLTGPEGYSVEIAAGETTTFEWKGLAAGEYTLEETTVPEGYNKADNIAFTIEDENYDAGNLVQSQTVVNNQGATLPSTGGIGTTIFYIVGAILVIGAGVVLVTRRRMSAR